MYWWRLNAAGAEPKQLGHTVLDLYTQLQSTISALIAAAAQQGNGKAEISIDALRKPRNSANGINDFLSDHLEPRFYNERRLPGSSVASRNFHIPELFVFILLNLDVPDILSVSVTCRGLENIIDASPRLKEKLSLKPDPELDVSQNPFRTPFHHVMVPGFRADADSDESANVAELQACFELDDQYCF